jgi:anti-anti-sigma factor
MTAFEVAIEKLDDVTVVTVRGELDQATLPELSPHLDEATESDGGHVLIDLSGCEFIDSSGLAALVGANERVDAADDRRFAICCPENQVSRLIELTGIDRAIRVLGSRDDAITDLRAAASSAS